MRTEAVAFVLAAVVSLVLTGRVLAAGREDLYLIVLIQLVTLATWGSGLVNRRRG